MINGVHSIVFTSDADGVRDFFKNLLGFPSVDAGDGWLIFSLPPAELGIHPTDGPAHHELYLMCDDIEATVKELKGNGVEFTSPINDVGWGLETAFKIPGGAQMCLYEPKHPTAIAKD
jgi:predicted enzyme related to lactoylglutathione lyase